MPPEWNPKLVCRHVGSVPGKSKEPQPGIPNKQHTEQGAAQNVSTLELADRKCS